MKADEAAPKTTKPDASEPPQASLGELLSFADAKDGLLMSGGMLMVVVSAANQPAQLIIFGRILDSFNQSSDVAALVKFCALLYVLVGVQQFVTQFGQTASLAASAARQAGRWRAAHLRALLRQEVGWFDGQEQGQLATSVMEAGLAIEDGLGEKLGLAAQFVLSFVFGFAVALYYCWPLALALAAVVPAIFGTIGVIAKAIGVKGGGGGGPGNMPESGEDADAPGGAAYARAGSVAIEALSAPRTVASLGNVRERIER